MFWSVSAMLIASLITLMKKVEKKYKIEVSRSIRSSSNILDVDFINITGIWIFLLCK